MNRRRIINEWRRQIAPRIPDFLLLLIRSAFIGNLVWLALATFYLSARFIYRLVEYCDQFLDHSW